MQSFSSSFVRQPFAVTKCCHSKEKKPRLRRSKGERKMMVESFINKYRNTHNGEFPSLNLTHKEVGGSFYTVREIVREIIQENKVLGSGSLSLESLNFEDYMVEEQKHPNADYELSLSSFVSATNCTEPKVASASSEHEVGNLQQTETHVDQGIFLLHQNDSSISQSMQNVHSDLLQLDKDLLNQHQTLVTVDSVEVEIQKPISQSHSSKTYEALNPEGHGTLSCIDVDKVEQLYPVDKSLFSSTPEKEVVVDEDAVSNSRLTVETSSADVDKSAACKTPGEDRLPKDEILSSSLVSNVSGQSSKDEILSSSLVSNVSNQSFDSSVDSEKTVSQSENNAIEASSCESDLKRDDFDSSQQLLGIQSLENEVIVSPSQNHEVCTVNMTENRDVYSSDIVNEETNHSTSPTLRSFASPAGPSRSEADLTRNMNRSGYVSSKSQDQGLQDISRTELKKHDDHKKTAPSSTSHLRGEMDESMTAETNPFWDAIKAVLSAVIKFLTE